MKKGSLASISGGDVMTKILINTFFILLLLLPFPFNASSEEIYEFERMWPVLEQPWYFYYPHGITVDSSGNTYVADLFNHRVQKFTSDGQFITKWGSKGSGDGQFDSPYGIATDNDGNVYVADRFNYRIQKFTSNGQFIAKWGSKGSGDGQFDWPEGIAVDSSGNIYVAEYFNKRIQKFTSNGQFITKWGSYGSGDDQFYSPFGIAIDSSGTVYVADTFNHRIQKFTSNGQFIAKWGSAGIGDGQFYSPFSIAIDSSGTVYVADTYNHRIQKFTSDGQFITKWGSSGSNAGEFSYPEGVAVSLNGKVYVSDSGNNRIQVFKQAFPTLTVLKSGTGSGTVTSNPAGIDCGSDCTETYNVGTVVTLTATPALGSTFEGWIGACSGTGQCSVTMDTDKTVTAAFNQHQYTLTVTKAGKGSGMVTSSPGGIDCGSDCSETYNQGTSVTLTATPASGSTFGGWLGGGCSGTGTCVVVMNADIAVTAAFSAKAPAISVSPGSLDFGSVKIGKKITKTLKITNNSLVNLMITLSGLEGTDFSIHGSSSVTIKAKKTYSLKVLCTPTSGGLKTATLEIHSNDPDTPTLEIPLTAALPATTPDISVAQTTVDFGSVKLGKKATKTLKITNNGSGDLVITLAGLEETDFSIQGSSGVTIKSKKSYTLKVLFTPKSAGLKTATLKLESNDPDTATIDILLSGTGQ